MKVVIIGGVHSEFFLTKVKRFSKIYFTAKF